MKLPQAILFDFDGVLMNSIEIKLKAFSRIYGKYGKEIEELVESHQQNSLGLPRRDKFKYYHQLYLGEKLPESDLDELCEEFSNLVFDQIVRMPSMPGALDFLEKYSGIIRCFVVSASPQDELKKIIRLKGMKRYFQEVLGVPPTKPENVANVLASYDLDPMECLYFGDTMHDLKAAKENKIPFIGVKSNPESSLDQVGDEICLIDNFIALTSGENSLGRFLQKNKELIYSSGDK